VALVVAPTLDRLAKLSRPAIWVLGKSTDLVVRLLGGDPRAQREQITEEELRDGGALALACKPTRHPPAPGLAGRRSAHGK
jgi:CBS domain containing-hemolysin-like protein